MMRIDLRARARPLRPDVPRMPHLAESAILTWHGRMINEYGSSVVFEALASQLAEAGWDAATVAQCGGFADEERRHGILCGAVVEALGGAAVAELPDAPSFPRHPEVPRREAALRNVLSVCCLSETVAVSLIGAERLEMQHGPLRDLLTRIYADEVGHARFGWTLLTEAAPELDGATRARLSAYLRVAFQHLERHELAHLPTTSAPPPEGAALGLCSGSEARELFYDTIREVIVPGLEGRGLSARMAWETRGGRTLAA
jgi:hypothetical protein